MHITEEKQQIGTSYGFFFSLFAGLNIRRGFATRFVRCLCWLITFLLSDIKRELELRPLFFVGLISILVFFFYFAAKIETGRKRIA